MKFILPLKDIRDEDMGRSGGKARALAVMTKEKMNVPRGLVITTDTYDAYVSHTGLRSRIMMELNRKFHEQLRWEELWDMSLRIRNMFVNTPLPQELYQVIRQSIQTYFPGRAVVVRSSAPGEDTAETSFAGLHASYVNVRGTDSVVEHTKLVWASLWTDASLLYRKELGLDERKSSMAVVVQEIVSGDASGIVFGQNPNDPGQCVIEAVYGLNQGLVDGTLEPDRWILDRTSGDIISHTPAVRNNALYPSADGTVVAPVRPELQGRPPLAQEDVRGVYSLVMHAERIFGQPQDVEWTMHNGNLFVLQARPITTLSGGQKDDKRGWYLSLSRSFENLKAVRKKIEDELVPALLKETEEMSKTDLSKLSDHDMEAEVARRRDIFRKWKKIYWDYFIPFAHGMRLFGTFYNDTVKPSDPYEFLTLMSTGDLVSLQRNRILQEMASLMHGNDRLLQDLKKGDYSDPAFSRLLRRFVTSHGDLLCGSLDCREETPDIVKMVVEMATSPAAGRSGPEELQDREQEFLSRFDGRKREDAAAMLDIARASYRMRDNDNIYMGRLKARVLEAEAEQAHRGGRPDAGRSSVDRFDSLSLAVREPAPGAVTEEENAGFRVQVRQITGQPAGPGIAAGPARVISNASDLLNFKKGEVLVCDAIDPNMTFVVPLAAAIVERRGGMLIHGAIIAREYGIPCVTGITRAAEVIHTGDRITVDGYLGIVILDSHELEQVE